MSTSISQEPSPRSCLTAPTTDLTGIRSTTLETLDHGYLRRISIGYRRSLVDHHHPEVVIPTMESEHARTACPSSLIVLTTRLLTCKPTTPDHQLDEPSLPRVISTLPVTALVTSRTSGIETGEPFALSVRGGAYRARSGLVGVTHRSGVACTTTSSCPEVVLLFSIPPAAHGYCLWYCS